MTSINNVTLNSPTPNITATKSKSMEVSKAEKESKNVQNELTSEQQRLKRVSSDEDMSAQEKAKKRQEIQKQIDELNRKLRLLSMEKKEEEEEEAKEQEKKIILKEELLGDTDKKAENTDKKEKNDKELQKQQEEQISKTKQLVSKMKNMLSADSLVQNDHIEEKVNKQKEHKKSIMKAEIKADKLYGTDTDAKREELENMRKKEQINAQIRELKEEQASVGVNSNAKIIIKERY